MTRSKLKPSQERRRDAVKFFLDNGLMGEGGFKEALLAQDYKPQYAHEHALELLNSDSVQRLMAEERAKRSYSKEKAVVLLEELKKDCETAKDRTNRLGVIKELDRIHGLYGDEETGVTINQVIVSPEERKKVLAKELKLLDDIDSAPLAIAE